MEYVSLIGAGLLYAAALRYFVLPAKIILTGTEGVATSFSYYFDSTDLFILLYLIFQVILISFAFARVHQVFARRTLVVVATTILALIFYPEMQFADPNPTAERLILVLFGGIIAGLAKAIAFRNRGSAGDEDIIAAWVISRYMKPVGGVMIAAAAISTAIGLGLVLLKNGEVEVVMNTLMYTCIYIFASVETLNNLYRRFHLTMLTVITECPHKIGAAICERYPHRTYTVQEGIGGRSGKRFFMLRIIITHEELPEALLRIDVCDPHSFYWYHDVEGISSRYYIAPIGEEQ